VPEVEPLVAEIHGLLELLRIERPPLGAAHTPSLSPALAAVEA